MTTVQLRDYRIDPAHFEEFLNAWRSGVRPLRERHGFNVHVAWIVRDESRFVWAISYAGSRHDFQAADAAYYASPERAALDPDPAQWIIEQQHSFVEPTDGGRA